MRKNNRWVHGKREFVAPPLPNNLKYATGCLLQEAIFDHEVGSEIYLAILEEPDYCETYSSLERINLFCKTGAGRTNNGIVAFVIFSLLEENKHLADYELFLNPHNTKTIEMLSSLGLQSFVKVVIYDSQRDRVCNLFDIENSFGFSEFVSSLAQVIRNERRRDFAKAKEEFMNKYSLKDLLEM